MQQLPTQIENLYQTRYHGAVNIRGIRYQVLYSAMRVFELYENDAPESIHFEGVEDVDVNGIRKLELDSIKIFNQYIQIKSSINTWYWSTFRNAGIIENFLDVWKIDNFADFLVVTNFDFNDEFNQLIDYCNGTSQSIPNKIETQIQKIFGKKNLKKNNIEPFLKRIKFRKYSEDVLLNQIRAKVVKYFDLQANNPDIYILSFISTLLDWAAERRKVTKTDLEQFKVNIQGEISKGTQNIAVQNGWIERLEFQADRFSKDYYEGANARPGHIFAALDVERPLWIKEIENALEEAGTCIIRTASGQGKSTLLYRYAYQNYQPETTFIIKNLSDEQMVAPIKQNILARKNLGLPILVLIDNVQANLRYWYRLISELTEHNIHFIVSLREEDWFRYSGNASLFKWQIVTPELSLNEAKQIFNEFEKQNRIAESIESAEQAFEQVAERKLLLEFTYLITHGQMLEERLQEQVRKMQTLNEDKAKLHILRLVSVAQKYGAKVSIKNLLNIVSFDNDPNLTLESLRNEYLLFFDEFCEGLHLVRSEHLVEILHSLIPVEETMKELILILGDENLAQLVSTGFSDPEIDHNELLEVLFERCQSESLETITQVIKGLFTASEKIYFFKNKYLFDEIKEENGRAGVNILSIGVMPFMPYDFLAEINETLGDQTFLGEIIKLQKQFPLREWENRIEIKFLQKIINHLSDEILIHNFNFLGDFLDWCRLPSIENSKITQQLNRIDWSEKIVNSNIQSTANFLLNLFHLARNSYDLLIESHKDSLQGRYKLLSKTIFIEERNKEIFIEFIVDESSETPEKPHEQASNRLDILYKMFPFYERYCSKGLYPFDLGTEREFDDTQKKFPLDNLQLKLNAHKNAIWGDFVESFYSISIVYRWQKQWFAFRENSIKFIEKFIDLIQKSSLGVSGNFESLITNEWATVRSQYSMLEQLPTKLGDRVDTAQRQINSWGSDVQAFLSQVVKFDDENSKRLCRYNLREAAKKLNEVQANFKIITDETQPYFNFSVLDANEKENYILLAEMLDVLYDKLYDSPIRNIKAYLETRKKEKNRENLEEIKSLLNLLENKGFHFTYPQKLITDGNELSIILGFEVVDFRFGIEQMGAIIESLANISFDYWFLHIVPLLNGNTYQPNVWRISQSAINEILVENKNNAWALLPLEADEELLSFIPNNKPVEILETRLVGKFNALIHSFHIIRRMKDLLIHRLDRNSQFDNELAKIYEDKFDSQIKEVTEDAAKLFDEMAQFTSNLNDDVFDDRNTAWKSLVECCIDKYRSSIEKVNTSLSDEENKDFWSNREVEYFLGEYLNRKFNKS